jgi:aminoglycoside phosphotransferase family enzyme/predicted kinase
MPISMDLPRLITALSDPTAYPDPIGAGGVEVRQTHISVVFLVGAHAYKVKKPVTLGFVNYGTLERRRHFCEEEVRLNRRLAPGVYLGVVPVSLDRGIVRMEGRGEAVEWAVKMARLPESAMLRERVGRGEIGPAELDALARRIAEFHARAEAGQEVAAFGRFEVVAANARANFREAADQVGQTISRPVFERLRELTEGALDSLRPLIESRADRDMPRDGHGDLRLDHVYLFPDRRPPDDLVIVDAIEFDPRFRCADPIADVAFLVMDLGLVGRRDLARGLAESYLRASGDEEGRALLPFYTAYRAAVRGKVEGLKCSKPEVPAADRAEALARARAHWLIALVELEEPDLRPCLVLIGGLPGVGKSTLARALAGRAGFATIRSDEVRKELAGSGAAQAGPSDFESGIYTPEWTERTYAECLRRAEALLFEGRRVIVDASFRSESSRLLFLDAAQRWGVPAFFLACRAEPEVIRSRLRARRGDASDADWSTYLRAAEQWEPAGPLTRGALREIDSGATGEGALAEALDTLRAADPPLKGFLRSRDEP